MNALVLLTLYLQTTQQVQAADTAFRSGYAAMAQGNLAGAHTAFAKVVRLTPKVAAGHSAYGAVLLAEGDNTAAAHELELAHRLDPKDETAILNLATAYSGLRRYDQAVAMFHLLHSESTLTPEASLAYATALAAVGDIEGGIAQLRQALAAGPVTATLYDSLGTLLAQQKTYDEARGMFQKAIALDGKLGLAHLHLGALALIKQDLPMALTELGIATQLMSGDMQTLLQLGRAQTAARQDEAAVLTLGHARSIAPKSAEAAYALALALQNVGKTKEALPLFAEAAIGSPKDSAVLTNYALALVQLGNAKEAEAVYLRALTIDPHNPVLHEDLGVAYLQQSDLDRAIAQFQAGLALPDHGAPITAELHYDLGLAWKLKDRLPEAIVELELAATSDPRLPDPPYTLGVLYMQTGRFAEAAARMETVTELTPGNGEAWSVLGNVYKQMEQPEKAVPALRRAIELLPAQPSPHIALAAILAQQGDREGAAKERKRGADLSRVAVSRQRADFALRSGTALIKQGKVAEAIAQMRDAVAADPESAASHRGLAQALDRQGKDVEAAFERQKADALDLIPK